MKAFRKHSLALSFALAAFAHPPMADTTGDQIYIKETEAATCAQNASRTCIEASRPDNYFTTGKK